MTGTILGALFGLMLGFVLALATVDPEVKIVDEPEDTTFVALAFIDCNELKQIVFLSSFGRAEHVRINSTMELFDAQLRLATFPYERVYWVTNNRPCGWKLDEERKV